AVPGGQASPNGAQAILFYLLVYAMMTIGVFGVLLMLKREGRSIHSVRDLDGLSVLNPLAALLLAVFLFGLTGLPPTAGFWSKFNLLLVLWKSGSLALWLLAVGLVVNAAIAAWYYLRLIKNAYLAPPADSVTTIPGGEAPALYGAMTLFAVGTIAIFFFPNVLWNLLRGLG
ncbi:MAG: NADH-quinone oxidoreductase subunit N, partial [Planctomycetes bacterium]|nr:NADH-quinone oxidoreductase subunit N [Planctomycetota bacterium]